MESAGQMPKHNLSSVKKEDVEVKGQDDELFNEIKEKYVKKIETVKTTKEVNSTVAVQCVLDAKVKATGYVTGNVYVFNGAGSVQDVDTRDVEKLLQKRQGGRQCCGGKGYGNAMFALVEVN